MPDKPDKSETVEAIKGRLQAAQAVFVTEFRGLPISGQQKLRRAVRAAEGEFRVYKMTLSRRAATETGATGLLELLSGPSGLAFANGDPAAVAKALKNYADENPLLVLKGGVLGEGALTEAAVKTLASLEPRPVLLGKAAAAMAAPMQKAAGLFAGLLRGAANAISQLVDQRQAAGA